MKYNISSPLVTSAGMINDYSAAKTPEPNQYEITEIILTQATFHKHLPLNLTKLSFYEECLVFINIGFPQILIQKTCWFRPIYCLLLI
jgi:hypothetical protein